jgi:hypothetical protein
MIPWLWHEPSIISTYDLDPQGERKFVGMRGLEFGIQAMLLTMPMNRKYIYT